MKSGLISAITEHERKDLLIGWLAIALAFTFIFIRGGVTPEGFALFFVISLFTVGLGFLLHELAHKFMAIKYGYWAEFRKDTQMLLVAIALAALVGVVFAAPGATMIYSRDCRMMTREESGVISIAGPAVNLVLCIPFFLMIVAGAAMGYPNTGGILPLILFLTGMVGLSVNSMIAFFNMLPISVLDGKKVFAWNPAVFAVVIVVSLGLILLSSNFGGSLDIVLNAIL
ncbi:site-2 protease family protein [Methanolacinia petrolearia]|uniref:site-2 protease family protein n=1 Tax=Methanolacinia petrolearia TaxID=54120 RepID=UPI003BAAC804